jgi:hypothetical protein
MLRALPGATDGFPSHLFPSSLLRAPPSAVVRLRLLREMGGVDIAYSEPRRKLMGPIETLQASAVQHRPTWQLPITFT